MFKTDTNHNFLELHKHIIKHIPTKEYKKNDIVIYNNNQYFFSKFFIWLHWPPLQEPKRRAGRARHAVRRSNQYRHPYLKYTKPGPQTGQSPLRFSTSYFSKKIGPQPEDPSGVPAPCRNTLCTKR